MCPLRRPNSLIAVLSFVLLLPAGAARSAAFAPGSVVVYRIGDGASALTSAGTPVFLDEYAVNGTLLQSIALPTTGALRHDVGTRLSGVVGVMSYGAGNFVLLRDMSASPGIDASAVPSRETTTLVPAASIRTTWHGPVCASRWWGNSPPSAGRSS